MEPRNAERFTRDERGEYWYAIKSKGTRMRCYSGVCASCASPFLSASKQECCSRECSWRLHQKPMAVCPQCGIEFRQRSGAGRKYCSHSCAATARHKRAPITTPETAATSKVLRNSDNPLYAKDDDGQWWYTSGKYRTRAHVQVCEWCNGDYLISIFHRKKSMYCSKSCSVKAGFAKREAGGEKSHLWKGGKIVRRGYVLIHAPDHPSLKGTKRRYVFEHRLIMEKTLGRYLERYETVHHKNGIRDDNRPENLELWSGAHGAGTRKHEGHKHCATCTCFKLQVKD